MRLTYANHLLSVFAVLSVGGAGAPQVLPALLDVIPEARLNLVIYFLRDNNVQAAWGLLEGREPTNPQEFILHVGRPKLQHYTCPLLITTYIEYVHIEAKRIE